MAPIVPSNIGFCKVVGQLGVTDLQAGDADGKPNIEPWANKWIKCTPVPKKLTDLTNTPNALAIKTTTITLYTDDNGQIVGDPNSSNKWGWLVGSDDTDLNPHGWDYKFEFQDGDFPTVFGLAPQGGTILLPALIDSVGNEGELVGPATIAASAAASSAAAAAASAASISLGTPGGVATLGGDGKLTASQVPAGLGGGGSSNASDLTSGTLNIARIADSSLTAAKMAADVATQAELDAVNTALDARLDTAEVTLISLDTRLDAAELNITDVQSAAAGAITVANAATTAVAGKMTAPTLVTGLVMVMEYTTSDANAARPSVPVGWAIKWRVPPGTVPVNSDPTKGDSLLVVNTF